MPRRKCLTCPRLITNGSYCSDCRRSKGHDSNEYRRNRDILIAAWVAENGWVCPGDEYHASHQTRDLQADHIIPPALGGTHKLDNLRVRCGSSNRARAWRGGRVTGRGVGLPKHREQPTPKGIHNTYKTTVMAEPPEKNEIFGKEPPQRNIPRHFDPVRFPSLFCPPPFAPSGG